MAATSVLVQTQRTYLVTLPGSGASTTIELVRYVDTTGWVSGMLIATAYKKDAWASGMTATLTAHNVSRAADDPKGLYEVSGAIGTVSFLFGDVSPKLYVAILPSGGATSIGNQVLVRLVFTNATAGNQTVNLTLGVKLVGRDA